LTRLAAAENTVLQYVNHDIKASTLSSSVSDAPPLRRTAVGRALAARLAEQGLEVTPLLEAAYRLIRERGVVEPGVRDVFAEAGLANRSFYQSHVLDRTVTSPAEKKSVVEFALRALR
jgi:hypothetical protein